MLFTDFFEINSCVYIVGPPPLRNFLLEKGEKPEKGGGGVDVECRNGGVVTFFITL